MTILGPKVLLIGDSGTGKTFSAAMAAELGLEVFIIFTENSAGTLSKLPKPIYDLIGKKIFYHQISVAQNLDNILGMAEKVNKLTYELLTQSPDTGKKQATEYVELIKFLKNFKDDQTGREFGSVETWGPDRVLVIDSLSGLSDAVWRNHRGDLVTAGMQNYQVVQNMLKGVLQFLTRNLKCWVIMTAHEQLEQAEGSNAPKIYPACPGAKLAPMVGRDFDEVVQTKKDGDKFYWSSTGRGFASKTRYLPNQEVIPPTLKPVYDAFMKLQEKKSEHT